MTVRIEQISITAALTSEQKTILTEGAMLFLAELSALFEDRRQKCLALRDERQRRIDDGELPDFLLETRCLREQEWRVAEIPLDLQDRRVEITGPVDRKMVINALNSGANVFMADFEDSNSPTWQNNVDGQINLRDAVSGTIHYTSPDGKLYELGPKPAVLVVRPRGWHLTEKHFLIDGRAISGSLFDFGLYFFHNARQLIARGTGPYFYLPKLESHLEARLWNDVFIFAQDRLGIPRGSVRATVLIETILASFEMDEILYELRDHSAGLNCGRWDYIFSFIKKFRNRHDFILPNRAEVTMGQHFLNSYVQLLIHTCHRRNAQAMGGMAAQIPIKNDAAKNQAALEMVRRDKLREVLAGHDGTWVAHPGLVPIAKQVFDKHMKELNQIHNKREEIRITAKDLLTIPQGNITEEGLRWNIGVGLEYLTAWISGNGCVPIANLMEDAATAEICRAQIWQWVKHRVALSNGEVVKPGLVRSALADEVKHLEKRPFIPKPNLTIAARLLQDLMVKDEFREFLTLAAYEYLD